MLKPCIYYRVSTTEQRLASQKEKVEKWLTSRGFDPDEVPVYFDKISGKSVTDRPQFNKMIKACMEGEFDTIVCYKLDRFSRITNHAIKTLIELEDVGVGFIAVTQPALQLESNNPFRKTILMAFAEIAQIERENIVERIKDGLAAAKKRGQKLGQPRKATDAIIDKILYMNSTGKFSSREIGRTVGLSHQTVLKVIKDIEGSVEPPSV